MFLCQDVISQVTFGFPSVKPCWQNTDYGFCPIHSKLHMRVDHHDRSNPFYFYNGKKVTFNYGKITL